MFLVLHFVVSITHGRDEKVEKEDLDDECRPNENKPCCCISILMLEVFSVEFAECQQVLVHQGIQDLVREKVLEELVFLIAARVQNHQSISKSH